MQIRKINRPIFDLPPEHPARRFLEAFIECRVRCVGRELEGVDQEWFSTSANRPYRFSSFAYEYLSFDVELDGWLSGAAGLTDAEERAIESVAQMRKLVTECKAAAVEHDNSAVVTMCEQVLHMLESWSECIAYRHR